MAGVLSSTRVGYCYDPRMGGHNHLSYDHPEQPARISRIFEALENSGCTSRMIALPVREVSEDEVTTVHSRKVWERVNEIDCEVSPAFHPPGSSFRASPFSFSVPPRSLSYPRRVQR